MKDDIDGTQSTMDASRLRRDRPELPRGASVDRYLIVDKLGAGGMGVVYKAFDPELGRPIALKLLNTQGDGDEVLRGRLLREAQALARLQHPNIVAVHDVGTFADDVFIAMEFVDGLSLRRWLQAQARSQREILDVFFAAGEGLSAAHQAGLVHRDFKPDNVIVGRDGRVRVLDFGLARTAQGGDDERPSRPSRPGSKRASSEPARERKPTPSTAENRVRRRVDEAAAEAQAVGATDAEPSDVANVPAPPVVSHAPPTRAQTPAPALPGNDDTTKHPSIAVDRLRTQLTHAGSIMGTPRFMAPEQRSGGPVDERADQFSFCLSLYEALAGQYPFAGDSISSIDRSVLAGQIRELPANSKLPRWLHRVLLRGLSVDPAARYPSMAALLEAIRADPAEQRRDRTRIAALVGVLVVAVGGWQLLQRRSAPACEGAEHKLAGIWDAPRRQAIHDAFFASGRPYAASVWTTVEHAFDAYAHSWVAMHVDACEATHVRREQSAELLDLRMSCLDGRLMQLKTLSDLYATPEPHTLDQAAQSAASMPTLDLCADAAALRAPMTQPRDAQTRTQVDSVRRSLAQADALDLAGAFDRGLAIARGAVTQAEALHYAPVEADAELTLGQLLGDHGNYPESAAAMHRAFAAALAGRHDEAAALAATKLIQAVGERQAHYEEGDHWTAVAEALIDRLQRKDELLGILYTHRSILKERESNYDEALRDAETALRIKQRVFGPDHFQLAVSYHQLGNIHEARAEFPQALQAYNRGLDIEKKTLGPDHPLLAKTLTGIADVLGESGQHERSLVMYQSALEDFRRVQTDHPNIPVVYNNMGEELLSLDRTEEALQKFREAHAIWQQQLGPSFETVTALNNIGNAELDLHRPADALRDFAKAQKVCDDALGPKHSWCGTNRAGLADAERQLGKLDAALEDFTRALATLEAAHGAKSSKIVPGLLGQGQTQLDRHAPVAALLPLERALAIREAEPDDGFELAQVRLALGRALPEGDHERALGLVQKARDTLAKGGRRLQPDLKQAEEWLAHHRS